MTTERKADGHVVLTGGIFITDIFELLEQRFELARKREIRIEDRCRLSFLPVLSFQIIFLVINRIEGVLSSGAGDSHWSKLLRNLEVMATERLPMLCLERRIKSFRTLFNLVVLSLLRIRERDFDLSFRLKKGIERKGVRSTIYLIAMTDAIAD
jgi:hypothetical protein